MVTTGGVQLFHSVGKTHFLFPESVEQFSGLDHSLKFESWKLLKNLCSKDSFLSKPTLHQGKVCQHRFPRWSGRCFGIMIKITRTRCSLHLGLLEFGIADGVCTGGCRRFFWQWLVSADSARQQWEQSLVLLRSQQKFLCYLRANQGHFGIPTSPELMKYSLFLYSYSERVCLSQEIFMGSFFQSGLIPGGKENDGDRQAVFFTLESMRKRHGWWTTFILITLFLRWCMINLVGNAIKISLYGRTLSRAQDEGLRFLKTKSFAVITLRYCTRRLHCSCDLSERRSSIILRSSKHQGQHPMLCQKAFGLCSNSGSLLSRKALVAYRRRMRLGKVKQCRSVIRNEKNDTKVGISAWNTFEKCERWYTSQWTGSRHRCILENEAKSQEIERVKIRGVSSLDPCIFVVTGAERFHLVPKSILVQCFSVGSYW